MDTISLNIGIEPINNTILNLDILVKGVNSIQSPLGNTYCDFIKLNSNYEFNLKVSYPRFYKGINAFLVTNPTLCLEVNKYLVSSLGQVLSYQGYKISYISLIRVDIPFTYYMPDDLTFEKYFNVFKIMAHIYHNTRANTITADVKGIIDMISTNIETVTFTSTRGSGGNKEITIYNQYLNIQRKTSSPVDFENYTNLYPDLKKRIRIEVCKRINRKSFSPLEFSNFNILGNYGDQCRKFLLDNLLNLEQLSFISHLYFQDLDLSFKNYIQTYGRINYSHWLHLNKELLIDYSIIRQVLQNNIPNSKTLESAVTVVRKELLSIDSNIIVSNTISIIQDIRKIIKDYKFIPDEAQVLEFLEVLR